MGSPLNIIFYAPDSVTAGHLAAQCFSLADSLNMIFSDYLPESELSRLSATAGKDSFVKVSPQLYDILVKSYNAWKYSRHTFDITIGPLSKLWRKARRSKEFPDGNTVAEAKARTGFDQLIIDTSTHMVKLMKPGMQLDLGGIAKGYVAQVIVDYLSNNGIRHALADAGGDLATSGAPPGKDGWRVGVNVPENAELLLSKYLKIQNKAVATSGDIYQYIEHDGKKYAHIIDPATGYGVTWQRNVTVIADDGALADWLASACSILPLRKAKRVARRNRAALLITCLHDGKVRMKGTPAFFTYFE